jgi:hypothetical protein
MGEALREMVLKHGWDRTTTAVDKAASLWCRRKVDDWLTYAWGILSKQVQTERPRFEKPPERKRAIGAREDN